MTEDTRPQPYSLRLEPETRAKIETLAKSNGRSLNAQIALMLDEWLAGNETVNSNQLTDKDVRRIVTEELSKAGLVDVLPDREPGFSVPMQKKIG